MGAEAKLLKDNHIKRLAATGILFIALGASLFSQQSVLDRKATVRLNNVKRQQVLKSLSRQTGFIFTYDTELIMPSEIVSVNAPDATVREILDQVFQDNNFDYSVIENHIIIYRKPDSSTPMIEEEGRSPVYLITGTVVEEISGKPLPYATVGIYRIGKGVITNEEGNFSLKLSKEALQDTLRISYLGFSDRTIPVLSAINNHYLIELKRDYVPIPEVIIRTRKPLDLIERVLLNKKSNYGDKPVMATAFYREAISRKDKIQLYSEAILNIYKSAYSGTLRNDQVKVYKSRKIENIDSNDTLILKLQSGLYACLDLDGIKNDFDFLTPAHYNEYNYRMTDIVNIGDEAAYVVEFSQKEDIDDLALFRGSVYINTDNYGVHATEFEINPDKIHLLEDSFVRESSKHYSVKPRRVRYRVEYRFVNGRYYLNHVRGDLDFHARRKRKVFGSNYNIMFEMAVNSIDSTSVERFQKEELAPRHTVFSETIRGYDSEFWGVDNYMHPEQDIQDALNDINARLSRFKR